MSFSFQWDYLQHVAQDVIKTVTLLFLSFGFFLLLLWSYPAAVATPQRFQLLSQTVCIYYFSSASAPVRNPRPSDYNRWTSVWSLVQHQRGGLSAGSEWGVKVLSLRPVGAHYPLISSSRADHWCRREYASLYSVEKKEKKGCFLSVGTEHEAANAETSPNSCFWLSFQPNVTI